MRRVLVVLCCLLAGVGLAVPASAATGYAPLNRPGPALDVPRATLAAALNGPAHPAHIDASVCNELYQPGVDPANAQNLIQVFLGLPGLAAVTTPDINLVGAPEVASEPALRCYVFASGC